METLGHTSRHMCYYEPLIRGIFTGDAAGVYLSEIGITIPTTPPPFRLDMALASLDKLADLKPKVLYYTHFGAADGALEKLKKYAERLKLWAEIVKQAIEKGENFEAVREKIFEKDEDVRKAWDYIRAQSGILGEALLDESVEGFIDFSKKFENTST